MVVYVEFAFAENALLDGALAYLSVKCVRGRTSARRILLSAAAGGAFAVLFPLVSLPAAYRANRFRRLKYLFATATTTKPREMASAMVAAEAPLSKNSCRFSLTIPYMV